jgi:hypothetical protein
MRKPILQFTVYKFEELQPACQRTAICRILEANENEPEQLTEEDVTPEWIENMGYEFFWDGEIYHDAISEVDIKIEIVKLA